MHASIFCGISRRGLLRSLALAAPAARAALSQAAPLRTITQGPLFHWFGYYDKLQFDPTSRYVLSNQVRFEHRSPRADDVIGVGMVDTAAGDRWIELGESRAWNWQQGCMLQWLPGSATEVIWNDREGGEFVSHILNVRTRKRRTLPAPVYALSPDARRAVYPDFRRLNDVRPGYGYAGPADPWKDALRPDDSGIWRLDLKTGKRSLILSLAQVAAIPNRAGDLKEAKHWFNHLLVSPGGGRFIFLHRWRSPGDRTFSTRMFTSSMDGKDLHLMDPYGKTSHFIWRDSDHVLAWAWHPSMGDKFYLYRDRDEHVEAVGPDVMMVNGHCTYLPGKRYILNDTYPDKQRNQNVYLFDTRTGRRIAVGSFHLPPEYTGEWRCDTHPRYSPDGKKVVIDSPHPGNGRQLHLIDIGGLVT